MKLIQINSVYNTGSTGRIVEGIAAAARHRGHRTWAVFARKSQTGPTDTYRVSGLPGQLLHGFFSLTMDAHGLGSGYATRRLVQWLDKIRPDIISLHNLHGYYLHVPVLFEYLQERDIRVVWTLHDCWPFTGHCSYFDRFECRKWQTECHDCPMTGYYPKSLIDRSTLNYRWKREAFTGLSNLTIVTPSRWLASHVQSSLLAAYPIRVIPNGIDLSRFQVQPNNSREPVILGVANRWNARKGLADFVKLRAKLPAAWRIVLVGVSRADLKSLPSGIEGIPRTESVEELVQLYSDATVYVNPTYSDNFPTTNLEALACGTPVVTYDTGGSHEAVDRTTGSVVAKGDIAGLKNAVEMWLDATSAATIKACRTRAQELYDQSLQFDKYADLFESVLQH